ncbi:transglutaminase family protein [Chthonobacter rhizosphaerae]|uniref:transglutaminase family protein n=1 Tax=Chthonobacter rhizosphaerae TaxID=2735553 RepID=UPI0015EEF374|nr:transglutaminase family protein [Chthonobacter rhizosphaerae]
MIYDVRQVTTYDYGSVVPFSRHVARLTPVDRPGQAVRVAALGIEPPPAERSEADDFFGNRITSFALDHPHDLLKVELRARIEVAPAEPLIGGLTPPWETVADLALGSDDLDPRSPAHGLYPSRRVTLEAPITAYAAGSFPAGQPILDGASDLMRRIRRDFRYAPGSTDAATRPDQAFATRRGVCQDFAHVMIAGLRGLGLPARYVSGYLRTDPPPGRPRLEGADATHAWVSVWCGADAGWVGLDPTNAMLAGEDHIVLAIGRDYADVSPLDGVIIASGGHTLDVKVDVIPVGPPPRDRPALARVAERTPARRAGGADD